MSSIGHVLDMVRRDKENRDLRKNFSKRSTSKDQCVLKSDKDIRDVPVDEIVDIRKKMDAKHRNDEYMMGKNMILVLLGGVIIVLITFYILSVIGWL